MDFLKSSKRRSFISEFLYIGLNVAFAIALLVVIVVIGSLPFALILVLLGKWRILAVRPRYWFANLQANVVDIIVGLSFVILMYVSGALLMQIALTMLYIVWLLYIKPRSRRIFVAVQAGSALFLGTSALLAISADWIASLVVVGMWLIGYSTAQHVLGSYEESHSSFYSLVWGFVIAELGWLAYHWTFAYTLPGMGNMKLSQAALIVLALSFIAERCYSSYTRHGHVASSDVLLPAILSVSVIMMLLVMRNAIGGGDGILLLPGLVVIVIIDALVVIVFNKRAASIR